MSAVRERALLNFRNFDLYCNVRDRYDTLALSVYLYFAL